jgi:protein TonB
VDVVKGNPLLVNAAVDAVRTWRYKPARLNGIEVETEATAVIFFKPN